jgi:hypothetical protein
MTTLRQAAQAALEAFAWNDPAAEIARMKDLRDALAAPEQEPDAVRHSFDGYGWMYKDNGSGSNWFESAMRYVDAEPMFSAPPEIEALTKERDELQEKITAMCSAIPGYDWGGDSEVKIADLVKERDALAAEVTRLDAGWHKANGDTLDAALERDALAAAVKLAIGEMEYNQYAVADISPHADVMAFCEAIETLKKVALK